MLEDFVDVSTEPGHQEEMSQAGCSDQDDQGENNQ